VVPDPLQFADGESQTRGSYDLVRPEGDRPSRETGRPRAKRYRRIPGRWKSL